MKTSSEAAVPPADGVSSWRWQVCLLLLAASTLNYMDRMALNQSASDIKLHFNLNDTQYGTLESAFSFAFALGALGIGWFVDRRGVFYIYPAVVALWSLSGFMTGFAPTYVLLLVCRFSLGLSESGNWPCGIVTTRRVFEPAQRSLGNAFFQGGTALGAIITPIVVLYCTAAFDPLRLQRDTIFHLAGSAIGGVLPAAGLAWNIPFQVIGLLGFLWVGFWFLTMRRALLLPPPAETSAVSDTSVPWYRELFASRRYWLLILVIVAVNVTWHTFRVWMPLFLEKERGLSRDSMNLFMSLYYVAAECGSICVGLGTLYLAGAGRSVHGARLIAFFSCGLLVLGSLSISSLPDGPALRAVLLLYGFGSLGLFPTYFSLSQEVSARHQGKVTGSLGCINALIFAGLVRFEGALIDDAKSYSKIIMFAGLPPLLAGLVVWRFWTPKAAPANSTAL